jgi:dissimilatory sulfite reductase (desulfoviridin) alpha/beta subunit
VAEVTSGEKRIGYVVYLGGCAGRTPRIGFKLEGILTEDQVLPIIAGVVKFFKENAKPRQRLALLIEEFGREAFLKVIL